MSELMSNRPSRDEVERTQVQPDPPQHPTAEIGGESTHPTFGTLAPTPAAGYPFLSPPQAADELGRLGEYRVLKLLGEGGMGFVFRGEDTALHRPVALKVMRPEVANKPQAADRFLREGRAAAGLKSDHVITIYQVGQANGVPFLAMEFLEGLPVDVWFRQQKKAVTLSLAVRIARDCLRGLAVAHDKGLVHRDIKPANLWIEKGTGRVKVLDFGLTRGADGSDQMTIEGAVVGTPAFMAPEQAGGKPVDPRADLFSVGTVLYALLTGQSPFNRDTVLGTLGAVGYETVPPVHTVRPDVPAALSAFIDRLMSKKPEGRPADAKAALKELAEAEKQTQQLQATQPPAPPAVKRPAAEPVAAPPRKPTNKLLLAGGLFGFLAAAVCGIVVVIKNKDGTETTVRVPDGASVVVKADGQPVAAAAPPTGPPTHAVLIGVNRYEHKEALEAGELNYAESDVVKLETALQAAGLPDDRILTMTTAHAQGNPRYPTAAAVRAALKTVAAGLTEADCLLVAVSGYERQFEGRSDYALATADLHPTDRDKQLMLEDVYTVLKGSKCRRAVVLVDSCRVGENVRQALAPADPPPGVAVIFGCSGGQNGYEHPSLGGGVLTYHFVKGLRGAADADKNGEVAWPELFDYVRRTVPAWTKAEMKVEQLPSLFGELPAGGFRGQK